jgi:Flp pilus assembly pilin Flp
MDIMSRLLREDSGDDLLEYALLSAVVGIAGAIALALMPSVINTVYSAWNVATQDAWQPADPIP